MKKMIPSILVATLLASCVSQEKYDALQKEKELLQAELQEIKYGVPALLADGKKFYAAEQYAQAKAKLTELVSKHPDRPESGEAKSMLEVIDEELAWQEANTQATLASFVNYVERYKDGKYVAKAKPIIRKLKIEQEEQAYENAVAANSSARWKQFLDNYPDREDIDAIKKEIIRLEVQEIIGDRETGQLPASSQTGYSNSASSTISITNDTECDLIVRYSGPDIRRIDIPAGGTREVYLPSGSYQVAATACGENYAGNEHLSGKYSSRFYIVTTRY